jgi:arsenate reductase-like glutaredoxin family protein
MSEVTIYHNPACGTSRNTLALIRNSGTEPDASGGRVAQSETTSIYSRARNQAVYIECKQ